MNTPPDRIQTDVAVLGSGPGGSITACLLAEAGRQVVWIEEGPFLSPESCPPFSREEMVTKYRNGGLTVALGRTNIAYVEGRCVGGGSEINSGLYHRTPSGVLESWRSQVRAESLTDADMQPFFEANEHDLGVSPLSGPAPPASLKLRDGAAALGWTACEVPRWFAHGQKQTMTRTFVPRAVAAGASLMPDTRAIRLNRRNQHWNVTAEHTDCRGIARRITIRARHVFLACGAIQTPTLLRRSGLAPLAGRTLRVHPTVKAVARFNEVVNTPGMGVPMHQVHDAAPGIGLGCSMSGLPHLALAMTDHPTEAIATYRDWRRMAVYYAMIHGGSGSVRPLPFFRDPLVRFRLCDADRILLADGLRLLCRCLFAAGATVVYPGVAGLPPLARPEDTGLIPSMLPHGRASLMTIHLFSTCPLGEDRVRCVVDSFGRVHGEQGLYVADASILPSPPGVNPQGTIMALVRRNARHFLENR